MVMIGVITDRKGFRGEMEVSELIAEKIELPEDIEVEIGYSANFTRKFILKHWKAGKRTAKLRIENIDSDEKTKQLMEMGIFVEEEVLKTNNPETTFTHELEGLKAIDAETGDVIGIVSDFLFLPANDVLVIDKGDSILSLPFIEDFIADIDLKKGIITLNLPDGADGLEQPKNGGFYAGND